MKAQHTVTFARVAHIVSLAASTTGEFAVLMSNLSDQYVIDLANAAEDGQVDAIIGDNAIDDNVRVGWSQPCISVVLCSRTFTCQSPQP